MRIATLVIQHICRSVSGNDVTEKGTTLDRAAYFIFAGICLAVCVIAMYTVFTVDSSDIKRWFTSPLRLGILEAILCVSTVIIAYGFIVCVAHGLRNRAVPPIHRDIPQSGIYRRCRWLRLLWRKIMR